MNFVNNFRVTTIWSSSAAAVGSTGDSAGTTAGSSGDGTTTKGGYVFASTGLDMAGYEGVTFIATVAESSYAILKAAFGASSTSSSTSWTDFPTAYKQGAFASTTNGTIVLDVVKPTQRFVAALVQVPSSSAVVIDVKAIRYTPNKAPVTGASTAYLIAGVNTVVGTTS